MQLPPAQIKAFARSRETRAKTDRIDAELIARFMQFRPDAGRLSPYLTLRFLKALTTRRAQLVEMRKRLWAQIGARKKQSVAAEFVEMDNALVELLVTQIEEFERRIEKAIAEKDGLAAKARLLQSISGIGPVFITMLIVEMPGLLRRTAGQAAAMTGLAPVPNESGAMRGKRMLVRGRRTLRHVLFQAALACHLP